MTLPTWCITAGGKQGQPCALAISVIKEAGQQALGLAQGLIATGRRRGIDDHQPQFIGAGRALLPAQVTALRRAAFEQGGRPRYLALLGLAGTPALPLLDRACPRLGIRCLRPTDAQGFFAQFGTSRRAPVAVASGGISPQAPWPCCVLPASPPCGGSAERCGGD